MSIDEIRFALTVNENTYAIALDEGQNETAMRILAQRDRLWDELVRQIQAEDPYTTEADIRYFEYND